MNPVIRVGRSIITRSLPAGMEDRFSHLHRLQCKLTASVSHGHDFSCAYINLVITYQTISPPPTNPRPQLTAHQATTYETFNIQDITAAHISCKPLRCREGADDCFSHLETQQVGSRQQLRKVYFYFAVAEPSFDIHFLGSYRSTSPKAISPSPLPLYHFDTQSALHQYLCHRHLTTPIMNHHGFNPGARNFNPHGRPMDNSQGGSIAYQVSAPPSPYLEARILNLEEEHADLRSEVDALKDLYHDLCNSFGKVQQIGRPTLDSSLSEIDLVKSRQSAMHFKDEFEQLSREVRESMNGDADEQKAKVLDSSKTESSDPPHMRAARVTRQGSGMKSLPPHLREAKQPVTVTGIGYVESLIVSHSQSC